MNREWKEGELHKEYYTCMNLGKKSRDKPRNRWQDEARED